MKLLCLTPFTLTVLASDPDTNLWTHPLWSRHPAPQSEPWQALAGWSGTQSSHRRWGCLHSGSLSWCGALCSQLGCRGSQHTHRGPPHLLWLRNPSALASSGHLLPGGRINIKTVIHLLLVFWPLFSHFPRRYYYSMEWWPKLQIKFLIPKNPSSNKLELFFKGPVCRI